MDAETRGAEFDYWLHERGYTYSGETSLYRLTIPEMARLYDGWKAAKEAEAEAQRREAANAGGAGGGRAAAKARSQAANPHRRRPRGQPRTSDFAKLAELENRRGDPRDTGA